MHWLVVDGNRYVINATHYKGNLVRYEWICSNMVPKMLMWVLASGTFVHDGTRRLYIDHKYFWIIGMQFHRYSINILDQKKKRYTNNVGIWISIFYVHDDISTLWTLDIPEWDNTTLILSNFDFSPGYIFQGDLQPSTKSFSEILYTPMSFY